MANSSNANGAVEGDTSTSTPSSLKQKLCARKEESARKRKMTSPFALPSPHKLLIQKAQETITKYCTTVTVNINPTMVPFMLPTVIEEDQYGNDAIRLNFPNVNHNTVDVQRAYNICRNLIVNPLNNQSKEDPWSLGLDVKMFVIHWKKVCCVLDYIFVPVCVVQ